MQPNRTVLFVCQFNSARSQLAEAVARSLAPPGFRTLSAGFQATVVNQEVLRIIGENGLDGSGLRSKSLDELRGERVDDVILLFASGRAEIRRRFPRARHLVWPLADPIAVDPPEAVPSAIRRVLAELTSRLTLWFREQAPCR